MPASDAAERLAAIRALVRRYDNRPAAPAVIALLGKLDAVLDGTPNVATIDAVHIARQRAFSERTFGPGPRTKGVLDHIRKELTEIEAAPLDLGEWVDVVILALDGAWRAGHEPQQIIDAIVAKQARNEARVWPDWRTADRDKAIEHDRSDEQPADAWAELDSAMTDALGGAVYEPQEADRG